MNPLDQPAAPLMEFDPARNRELRQILSAVASAEGGNETDAYDRFARGVGEAPRGTVRQVLQRGGVKALDRVETELGVFEKADAVLLELHQHSTRALDAGAAATVADPGALTTPQAVVTRYSQVRHTLAYADSTGPERFETDNLEAARGGRDLVAELVAPQRAATAQQLMQDTARKVARAANIDVPASERLRVLDSLRAEGMKQLDAALGENVRQLETPAATTDEVSPRSREIHEQVLRVLDARGLGMSAYVKTLDDLIDAGAFDVHGPLVPVKP